MKADDGRRLRFHGRPLSNSEIQSRGRKAREEKRINAWINGPADLDISSMPPKDWVPSKADLRRIGAARG